MELTPLAMWIGETKADRAIYDSSYIFLCSSIFLKLVQLYFSEKLCSQHHMTIQLSKSGGINFYKCYHSFSFNEAEQAWCLDLFCEYSDKKQTWECSEVRPKPRTFITASTAGHLLKRAQIKYYAPFSLTILTVSPLLPQGYVSESLR